MTRAHEEALKNLTEAQAFRTGSADREYRITAAWQLAQMGAGIPACEWTDTPPADFGPHYLEQERAA